MNYQFGMLVYDSAANIIKWPRFEEKLSPITGKLLCLFIQHLNRFVSKQQIITTIWHGSVDRDRDRDLYAYISKLRHILRGAHDLVLETRYEIGYRLVHHVSPTVLLMKELEKRLADGRIVAEINGTHAEEIFQEEIQHTVPVLPDEGPLPQGNKQVGTSLVWSRNAAYAAKALEVARYRCEFNAEHETFISAKSGNYYVEVHHLVPLQFQDLFEYSLDVPENLVVLCPNCHRAMHYGDVLVKRRLVAFFSERRGALLIKRGINISVELLEKIYATI